MLEVRQLHKRYADRAAVSALSFTVEAGSVVGLLGPNGAGKTTTISMIAGLVAPDGGSVLIAGEVMQPGNAVIKRRIGLVPQDIALYEDISAWRNLALFGALYDIQGALLRARCDEALALVGLADRAHDKPASFSGGMKRRLNLAAALIHDPDIILLDEPTVGVDPHSRNAIFDNLETLKARGKTLIYTTHYMEEAERLCDRIIIMDRSHVVANDTLANLYRLLPSAQQLEIATQATVDLAALRELPEVVEVSQDQTGLRVGISPGVTLAAATQAVMAWLAARGHDVQAVQSERVTLEKVFLALTGRQLRDE